MEATDPQPLGLLVIGSGPAGVHAAAAYVEAGGPGPVCLVSADPDEPYQRPPLSKGVLAGDEPPDANPILEGESTLAGVEVRLGTRVVTLDTDRRRVGTDVGHDLAYERLVLATGSEATELPDVEPGAPVFTLRSLDHARRLVAAAEAANFAVVVGSGFIGCEAAASLAGRGVRTTLVTPEGAPQAARLGDWVGGRIAEWLAAVGVQLRFEVQIDSVEASGSVQLDDDSVLDADLVLTAVGVSQSQAFLEESGLSTRGGRLVADEELQTSDPWVWAAGDVAHAEHDVVGRSLTVEHWGDAVVMGRLAGRNAAAQATCGGASERWSDPPGFWSEIGQQTLMYTAWGDGFDDVRVVEHGEGSFTIWYADALGEIVGVLTHERDEDYELGRQLMARRATLTEALSAVS